MKLFYGKFLLFALSLALIHAISCFARHTNDRKGQYLLLKSTIAPELPQFQRLRIDLPQPIWAADTTWIELYWKAWELAYGNFHQPSTNNGFVANFIDAAFNQNIFLWDTCFMTMFCSLAHPLVPGIESLDNFYCKQYPNGEICREIDRETGEDFSPWVNRERLPLFSRWGFDQGFQCEGVVYRNRTAPDEPSYLTLDALNHPLLSWAELESFAITGDRERLQRVFEPLLRYYSALKTYLRQGNGLYLTDWASMDNSPRNSCLSGGGVGIDISAEMVLFARNLIEIARLINQPDQVPELTRDVQETSAQINRLLWDPAKNFYFDLRENGRLCSCKTVAAYWTLVAHIASDAQAAALVAQLRNPATFGRQHRVPTCAADEPGYAANGGYWRGAVWAPTNTMVIRGLQEYGYNELAREIALEHLQAVAHVHRETGTIWENYQPDAWKPGMVNDSTFVKADFVGWSGIGPILYLIEFAIGLDPDAAKNAITWNLRPATQTGCLRYRFNGQSCDLIAEQVDPAIRMRRLTIRCAAPLILIVNTEFGSNRFELPAGEHSQLISWK